MARLSTGERTSEQSRDALPMFMEMYQRCCEVSRQLSHTSMTDADADADAGLPALVALGRYAGEREQLLDTTDAGSGGSGTTVTYQVVIPTSHFSETAAEEKPQIAYSESGTKRQELPLSLYAEVLDHDQLFLMSATPAELDAFPAKALRRAASRCTRTGGVKSDWMSASNNPSPTGAEVVGILFAYNAECVWPGHQHAWRGKKRKPLAPELCVNYMLKNALPDGTPFCGYDSGAEQGISADESGPYSLGVCHGNAMLTALLFVRERY